MFERKEPLVSLRNVEILRDFIIGKKWEDDAGDSKAAHSRAGQKIELPGKYAKDFEVEI